PIFKGKFIFINPGKRTFPIEMAIPIIIVPINKKLVPKRERTINPIVKSSKEKKIVFSIPKRLASFGAKGERKAKASKGSVVILPATAWLKSKSSRINEIREPTDVKGALKFAPTNI